MFGTRLREMRRNRKLTQQFMADNTRVSLRTYQYYEQGTIEPSLSTLLLLADLLDVSTDYLLGRTESIDGWQAKE